MEQDTIPLYRETLAVERYTEMETSELKERAAKLEEWKSSPNLLPRQEQELHRIMGHLSFELSSR